MTSGATTVLIDRLETSGHVIRHRESSDRRRATLRPTEQAWDQTRRFFAFAGSEIATAIDKTDPADAHIILGFLAGLTAAAAAANTRLTTGRAQSLSPPVTEHVGGSADEIS